MYKEIELKPTQIDAITKHYASKILIEFLKYSTDFKSRW